MTDTNQEFISDPTNHVIAVIDVRQDAETAAAELTAAGFDQVHLYRGYAGAHAIDSKGEEHGAREHAMRVVQQVFSNKDNLAVYEQATRAGAGAVAVHVTEQEQCDRAIAMLRRYGAHTINHFGTFVVETVEP